MSEVKKAKVGGGNVGIESKVSVRIRTLLYIRMYEIAVEHKDLAKQIASNNIEHMIDEIKESMISILFSYTCLENYINTIGIDLLQPSEWNQYKGEHVGIIRKWKGISKILANKKWGKPHIVFSDDTEPFKSFLELKDIREKSLVHRQAEFSNIVETRYGITDGTIMVLNCDKAEWACDVVKNMIKKLCENIVNPPTTKWLD